MRKLDMFAVQSHELFLKVLVDDKILINKLPPCVLVEVSDNKDEELVAFTNKIGVTKYVQFSITCPKLLIFQHMIS